MIYWVRIVVLDSHFGQENFFNVHRLHLPLIVYILMNRRTSLRFSSRSRLLCPFYFRSVLLFCMNHFMKAFFIVLGFIKLFLSHALSQVAEIFGKVFFICSFTLM